MTKIFDQETRFLLRTALAQQSFRDDAIRLVEPDLGAARWLISTQRGLYAISEENAQLVAHGWFFGLVRRGSRLFLFENCARHDRDRPMGRLLAFDLADGMLRNPEVIAKGLDGWCHQIAFIDDLLCLLDTANQCVLRFTEAGEPVDVKRPFGPPQPRGTSGDYLHINAIAQVPDGVAIMAHNAKRVPAIASELIRLDWQWRETGRTLLPEPGCHDIVADESGALWHCLSMSGALICSDGRCVPVTPDRMTRGLLFAEDRILVGASVFGERSVRDRQRGSVIVLDREFRQIGEVPIDGPPADIIAL